MQVEAADAQALLDDDLELDAEQQDAIDAWREELEGIRPAQEAIEKELTTRRSGYFTVLAGQASDVIEWQAVSVRSFYFWDALITMMLGMSLYKYRVFDASRSHRFYAVMALLGFAVGLPVNAWELYRFRRQRLRHLRHHHSNLRSGPVGLCVRLRGAGHGCFVSRRMWIWLKASLAAVGRMAPHQLLGPLGHLRVDFYRRRVRPGRRIAALPTLLRGGRYLADPTSSSARCGCATTVLGPSNGCGVA